MRVSRHGFLSSQQSTSSSQRSTARHQAAEPSFPSGPDISHPLGPDAEAQGATGGKERETARTQPQFDKGAPLQVERPLTCEEAASLLRVHPKTVKRMARIAVLPGHFRFGRWFFYASELDDWMRTELHSSRHSCR